MNSTDVHERRRIAAAVLRQKFGKSHGFQHHHLSHADDDDEDGEDGCGEFIDSVRQHVPPVHAAPSNRVARNIPTRLSQSPPSLAAAAAAVGRQQAASTNKQRIASSAQQQQQELNKYLLETNLNRQKIAQHFNSNSNRHSSNNNNNNNNSKNSKQRTQSSLKPVIETSSSGSGAQHRVIPRLANNNNNNNNYGGAPRPPSRHQRRPMPQQQQAKKGDQHSKQASAAAAAQQAELVSEVKRRLSLPVDTSIPHSFLIKHKNRLDEFRLDPEAPLSRIDRRRSLFEIGYGKTATYSKLHVLGAGTYSIVYKGSSRLTNRLVALKEIHLERDEGVPFTAIREVSLLKQLKHCNVITLHDIIYTSKTLTLVFEFVDRDLSRYMDECDHRINPENVKLFLFQILRALAYCHARKILHRDIKPQNILISSSGELKLADFGLARAKSFPTRTYTDEVVTLWYRPPDVLLGNVDYGACIDMWGVGCIFFEMIAGFTLFLGTPDEESWPGIKDDLACNEMSIQNYQGRGLVSIAPQLIGNEHATDLLERLLKCNPKHRISSAEALHHNFFRAFPNEIYDLHDSVSILSLATVRLSPEAHMKAATTRSHGNRQSSQSSNSSIVNKNYSYNNNVVT